MRHKLLPTNPPLSDGFSLRPRRAEAEKQRQEASHARWAACQDHKTWLAEKTWRKQVRFLPAVYEGVWSFAWFDVPIFGAILVYIITFFQERTKRRYINPLSWRRGARWSKKGSIHLSFGLRKEEEWGDSTKSQGGRCCRRSQESRGGKTTKLRPTVNQQGGKKRCIFLHPKKIRAEQENHPFEEENIYIISKAPCFLAFFFRCLFLLGCSVGRQIGVYLKLNICRSPSSILLDKDSVW